MHLAGCDCPGVSHSLNYNIILWPRTGAQNLIRMVLLLNEAKSEVFAPVLVFGCQLWWPVACGWKRRRPRMPHRVYTTTLSSKDFEALDSLQVEENEVTLTAACTKLIDCLGIPRSLLETH